MPKVDHTAVLDPLIWRDLLRTPYRSGGRDRKAGLDCWGLVAVVLQRQQIPVPTAPEYFSESPGNAIDRAIAGGGWRQVPEPIPNAVVVARVLAKDHPDHVGICIGDRRVLHIGYSAVRAKVESIDLWISRGWVHGYWVVDLTVPAVARQVPVLLGGVRVIVDFDPFAGADLRTFLEPWRPGLRVSDLLPQRGRKRLSVWKNGWAVGDFESEVEPGATVLIRALPAIPVPAFLIAAFGAGSGPFLAFAGNIIIGSLIGMVASVIAAPSPLKQGTRDEDSPTFGLDGVRNTIANGTPISVVYGTHRVGGQVLQAFFEVDESFRSTLWVLIGIGEGEVEEIGGYTGDWNGLASSAFVGNAVELDGNPAASFPTARFSIRAGRTSQAPIPGFDRTVVAFGQDRTLRAPSPLVPGQAAVANNAETFLYETTQAVDGFALIIRYPIGLYKIDATSGAEEDYSVYYTLRYNRKGNAASEVVEVVIHGPSQRKADHSRMIRKLGLARDVYEIRITRMSDNDENLQRRYSQSVLIAVNEYVSDDPIARNGKALIAMEAVSTAQLSGGVPTISAVVKGKKVHVWDGVSTTSPAFTFQWSDNPAWVALDILTNQTYGLGKFVSLNQIDLAAFKTWADYCDAVITTNGTSHKRWTFNHVFDTASKAWDALGVVAAAGRATIVVTAGRYTVKIDRETDPTIVFSMGNIVAGSMVTHWPKTVDRPNMVQVGYRNVNLDWDGDVAQLDTGVASGEIYVRQTMSLPGITDPKQAYRAAKYMLNVSTLIRRATEWQAPVDAVACEPGDVVQLQHDVLESTSAGGRLHAVPSKAIVNLDRAVTVPASPAWAIVIQSYNSATGTRVQQTATPTAGTYAAGDDIPITPSLSVLPVKGDVYAIGPATSYYTLERITKVTRGVDQIAKIEAVSYDPAIYDDDPGEIETFTEVYPHRRKLVDNPTGLRVVESIAVLPDGTVRSAFDVSFAMPRDGLTFDVWVRRLRDDAAGTETSEHKVGENEDWRYAGATTTGLLRVDEGFELKRPYQFSVTPRSPAGNRLDPRGGALEVAVALGKVEPPDAPTNPLCTELQDNRIRLTWTASVSREVAHYEVRATVNTGEPRKFLFSQVVAAAVVGTHCEIVVPKVGGLYFLISAVSRTGVRSLLPAYVSYTPKVNDRNVLVSSAEPVTWGGTKTKMTVSGVALISDLNETTGSYVTTDTQHALVTSGGLLAIFLDASGWQIDWTLDQCGYLLSSYHAQRMRMDGMIFEIPEPDQRLSLEDNDYPLDAPGAYLFGPEGQIDWDSNFKILVEYDLATDSGATTWDGWVEYKGPVYIPINRYYVRVRVTITNVASAKLRIQLDGLHVTQTAQKASSVVALDPNSHYAGADDVDARLVELGWVLKEQTKHWPNVQFWPSRWMEGGTFSYQVTPDMFGVQAQDAATPTLGYAVAVIPSWYLKSGSTVYTIDFYYWIGTSPGADQVARIEVKHRTFDQGDANFGSYTTTNLDLSIPNGTTANAPKRASLDVTSGDFGSGDEMLHLAIRRQGTAGADTYTGTVYIFGVKIRSGRKST